MTPNKRGDTADNVAGFMGIGDKRATTLMEDSHALSEFLERPGHREKFDKNVRLIKFHDLSTQVDEFETTDAVADWKAVYNNFKNWKFDSLTKPNTWDRFCMTFMKGLNV